jgi:hypothetical protein
MGNTSLLLCACLAACTGRTAIFREDFSSDPAARGWDVFGGTNLFHWNATNGNLETTWDSAQANSYYLRRLDTVLTKADDFSLAFDLQLSDLAVGVNPDKPSTFELALGFLNFADATNSNFERGTGIDAAHGPRNLLEFDYFPDSGFGATISPTMVSSNNAFAAGFDFPLELTLGDTFHVALTYSASNLTLSTSMTRNGQPFGPVKNVTLGAAFTDFRLDTLAIASYSDAGADGSLLAQGLLDNLEVTLPDPPIAALTGLWFGNDWHVEFAGRARWLYALERTQDFRSWTSVSLLTPAWDGPAILSDTNPAGGQAFYRVRAERP